MKVKVKVAGARKRDILYATVNSEVKIVETASVFFLYIEYNTYNISISLMLTNFYYRAACNADAVL